MLFFSFLFFFTILQELLQMLIKGKNPLRHQKGVGVASVKKQALEYK